MSFSKVDFLWKILLRYDSYYTSITQKGTVILAFNLFLFTGIITKYTEILPNYGQHPVTFYIIVVLLVIIAVSSLLSIFFTFKVISPYLKSPHEPTKYLSNIFFGHVSLHENPNNYHDIVKKMTEEQALEDLSKQTYILARGIHDKYHDIKYSAFIILFSIIPSIFGLIIMRIVVS